MTMIELVGAIDPASQAKLWVWNYRGSAGEYIKSRENIEPVIGVDVSKGSSVFQAFTGRNEALGKTEVMIHDAKGFGKLQACAERLHEQSGQMPMVILEATGHYHGGLVTILVQEGIPHCIVNPLQSKRARGTKLRFFPFKNS